MENNKYEHLKKSSIIAIVFLAILCIFSILFYELRMYFLDAPFIVFQIIKEDAPAIMVERYGAIVTQIFPFLAQKLGLPISNVLALYSLSFNLFYLIAALLLYRLKAYHWLILLAFYQIGFATDSFFWTNNEIHQGGAYFTLAAGVFHYNESKNKSWMMYFLSSFLLFISILTHPLIIPIVIFYLGFLFANKDFSIKNRFHLGIGLFSILLCLIKYLLSKVNWYDGGKFTELSSKPLSSWMSFGGKPAAQAFFPDLVSCHWPALLIICSLWVY